MGTGMNWGDRRFWNLELEMPVRHLRGDVEQTVGNQSLAFREDIEAGMIHFRGISQAKLWDWMRSPSC